MKTCPIIILCVLALFCILVLAMLLFFCYKNGERLTKAEMERKRMEQQALEAEKKVLEAYRRLYFDGKKAIFTNEKEKEKTVEESRKDYFEKLEKLCNFPQ